MDSSAELRTQLQSLSIDRGRKPASPTAGRAVARGLVWLLRLAVIVLVIGGVLYAWRAGSLTALMSFVTPSNTQTILRYEIVKRPSPPPTPVHNATGKIVSDHRVQVATKVSGQIVQMLFEQGDLVEKGHVLARIEQVAYRARRDEAAAMLARAKADAAFREYDTERLRSLGANDQSTELERALAIRDLDQARAQVLASEAALAWAQKALDDCEVIAPISGVILERNVEVGDFVAAEGGRGANANAQFTTIADVEKLRVEVDISEFDIARIHPKMPCIITPDAYRDRRYRGYVMWLDPGANYSKATVQTKVRIEKPDALLRVEGSAHVAFFAEDPDTPAANEQPGLWIPAGALLNIKLDAGDVFLIDGGVAKKTSVRIGRKRGEFYELLSGLSEGDVIVAADADRITDGQVIDPPSK